MGQNSFNFLHRVSKIEVLVAVACTLIGLGAYGVLGAVTFSFPTEARWDTPEGIGGWTGVPSGLEEQAISIIGTVISVAWHSIPIAAGVWLLRRALRKRNSSAGSSTTTVNQQGR